jgi:DNA-binding response OmpR family regulator
MTRAKGVEKVAATSSRLARILIVDDEPFNIDILEQRLETLGYETDSAANGQEALKKVAARTPDLILLDVLMPVMNGLETCRHLKRGNDTRFIPIIMMTTLDAVGDRIKGIEAGANDFLSRPVDDRELDARITTELRQSRAMNERINELVNVRDHYAKFVPEAVKRLIQDNPEAPELEKREQDVSILFVDICGYSQLSEALPHDELIGLVEQYFSAYLDCIHESGGDLTSTAGDGLMAIFREPDDPARHATLAVETAFDLARVTKTLNKTSHRPPVSLHMGLNSGIAVVGSTCLEGLRGTRWTFTAYGPTTNLAARLSDVAGADELLVGPESAERVKGLFPLEDIGPKYLKNFARPVETHRIGLLPMPRTLVDGGADRRNE